MFKPIEKQSAIRQTGERIVEGFMR